jgi:DNA-binding transcriptional ArsR family regulator
VDEKRLQEIAARFEPKAEVVAEYRAREVRAVHVGVVAEVLNMLRRRPCTVRDISSALGVHVNEVSKHLAILKQRGVVEERRHAGATYFTARDGRS